VCVSSLVLPLINHNHLLPLTLNHPQSPPTLTTIRYAALPVFSEWLIEEGYTKVYWSVDEVNTSLTTFEVNLRVVALALALAALSA
jgi:hypothetical protein